MDYMIHFGRLEVPYMKLVADVSRKRPAYIECIEFRVVLGWSWPYIVITLLPKPVIP